MKIEKYGEGSHKRRKRFFFFLIAMVFFGIVAGLIYYAYGGSIPFTGNFIHSQTPKNPVSLLADLNAPNQVIALDSGIGSIELVVSRGIPGNFLHVGKQKVNLGDSKDSEIIVVFTTNFKDKIAGGFQRPGRIDKTISFNDFTPQDTERLLKVVITLIYELDLKKAQRFIYR